MRYAAFVACCLIWGSTFLAIRIGNESVPPEWAATLRLSLAAPLLALIVVVRKDMVAARRRAAGCTALRHLQLRREPRAPLPGERVVPSGIAAVLYATVPLSTSLIAAAIGVEKLVTRKVIAAVVAIAGVGTIFAGEMRLDVPFEGLIAVFLAATAASLSSVLLKRAPAQPSVFATNAVGAAAGAVICLAASFVLGEDHALPSTVAGWWPVIYLTLAGSLGAYVIWTWLVVPVIAVFLGAIVLRRATLSSPPMLPA